MMLLLLLSLLAMMLLLFLQSLPWMLQLLNLSWSWWKRHILRALFLRGSYQTGWRIQKKVWGGGGWWGRRVRVSITR